MSSNPSFSKKLHKCTEPGCNAAFNRPYRLANHSMTHLGKKPYACDHPDCTKSYTNESHLKRHRSVSHVNAKTSKDKVMYRCGYENCGKVFETKCGLTRHLKKNHNSESLPFKCLGCETSFKRKSQLHFHALDHGNDPPYKCEDCSVGFVHLHLYRKHMSNHKMYQCDCGVECKRWSDLCAHKRTECKMKVTEHKCVICGKSFSLKQNLKCHSLTHIRDSQTDVFKCPYMDCNRSYQYKKNLTHHIKFFHAKLVDRVKCTAPNCDTVLKTRKNLKQHVRLCHSNLPLKERKPRRLRKDKGKPKKSMASKIAGFKISLKENLRNIEGDERQSREEKKRKFFEERTSDFDDKLSEQDSNEGDSFDHESVQFKNVDKSRHNKEKEKLFHSVVEVFKGDGVIIENLNDNSKNETLCEVINIGLDNVNKEMYSSANISKKNNISDNTAKENYNFNSNNSKDIFVSKNDSAENNACDCNAIDNNFQFNIMDMPIIFGMENVDKSDIVENDEMLKKKMNVLLTGISTVVKHLESKQQI